MSGRRTGKEPEPPSPAGNPGFPGRPLPTDDAYFDCNAAHSNAEPTETQP